ncbi:MAG TPA: hemin uptake protein HemP [Planctomycetota bacterium]|nr:hemin uptake protein HemP [Planctomycetota bacterium]
MISIKPDPPEGTPPRREPERATVTSGEILKGGRQVIILHDGQEYRLQLTKNGKLILTK